MPKSLHRLPVIVAAVMVASVAVSLVSAKTDWDQQARSRKAEYVFLEAQSAYCESDFDKYITLTERAYALDSSDLDIANEWAILAIMDANSDSDKVEKAYSTIKRHFYANPHNYISGVIFANTAMRMHHYEDALAAWETLDSINPTRPEIAMERAEAYTRAYALGDSAALDKALAIYDRLQEGSGRSVDLSARKIYAYSAKGDTLAIIRELDSLYVSAPNDSYTALYIGANYHYIDRPDEAIKYLDLACDLDSTNGSAYLARARFYNELGDSVAYDREVFMALKSQNLDVNSKIGILRSYVSELYTDTLQEPRIKQLFNDLQLMHAGEPEIHDLYGSYLYELADYKGAAEQFSYVTALTPNDEDAWVSYVQTSALANDTVTMVNASFEAKKRFPQNLYFPIVLYTIYYLQDDKQQAMEILDSVDLSGIKNEKQLASFITTKGDAHAAVGDTITALQLYDEALEHNPDQSMALNNAAYFIALTHGDLDKAERYSARSLVGNELNPTYLDTYAWVFFCKKDYKMAKHYIDIALNSYSYDLDAESDQWVAVGDSATVPEVVLPDGQDSDGSTDTLIDSVIDEDEVIAVEESIDDDLPSADIYDHAGDIYFMNGETEKALDFWKKASLLDPDDELIQKKVRLKTIFFR